MRKLATASRVPRRSGGADGRRRSRPWRSAARTSWRWSAQATARFHDVEAAKEAGYELGYVNGAGTRIITGCIAHPTAGAMGYHYFNKELIDDLVVDVSSPRAWSTRRGRTDSSSWSPSNTSSRAPAPTHPASPSRRQCSAGDGDPRSGRRLLHAACLGLEHNPSGIFAHWSPEVNC